MIESVKLLPLPESYKALPRDVYERIEANAKEGDDQLSRLRFGYGIFVIAVVLLYLAALGIVVFRAFR